MLYLLRKSLHQATVRHLKTGRTTPVKAYVDKVQKKAAPVKNSRLDKAVTDAKTSSIATRPDLMQFKRIEEADGTNSLDSIKGKWNNLYAGIITVWQPEDPKKYGLKRGEKYIVVNGHHRMKHAKLHGVPSMRVQVLYEGKGPDAETSNVTALAARRIGAEINIVDGKGSIYDQAKFLRDQRAVVGKDRSLERAREIGVDGGLAATIAFNAKDNLFTAFIYEDVTPQQAEQIAKAAPGDDEMQRIGIAQAVKGMSGPTLFHYVMAAKAMKRDKKQEAEQGDLFGNNDDTVNEMIVMAGRAAAYQKNLKEKITAAQGAANRPDKAREMGVHVADSDSTKSQIVKLKEELAKWSKWYLFPTLVAKVKSGELAKALQLMKAARQLQGRTEMDGLKISIENRRGSVRSWFNPHDGTSGFTYVRTPYGYIRGTVGTDGDHYDCFVGPHRQEAGLVYIVDCMKAPDFTELDEQKVMLGFLSQEEAEKAFMMAYNKPGFLGPVAVMPFNEFKARVLKTHETGGLVKAHIIGHMRLEQSGKQTFVREHDDKRQVHTPTQEIGRIPAGVPGTYPLPIRLAPGKQIADHKGWGLEHIHQQHGEEIRAAGYKDEMAFVEDVIHNYNAIYRIDAKKIAIVRDSGAGQKIHVVELREERGQKFYSVVTAYIADRAKFSNRTHTLLYRKVAKAAAELWELLKARGHKAYDRKDPRTGKTEHVGAKAVDGRFITTGELLDAAKRGEARKRGIKVPPAWTDVWLNPDPHAALQVKGRDAKGVLQRLYSKAHAEAAKVEKFARVKAFTKAYPKIAKQIQADFDKKPEARVLYLIAKTGFRLGGDEERGEKAAYGASTLKAEHITVKGNTISFNFDGKKGVEQSHKLTDKRLADYLRTKKRGQLFKVSQDDIRAYLKGTGHGDFLVKDFRTYIANDVALAAIEKMPEPQDEKALKKAIKAVCEQVAAKLGNQWTMARDSYISPEVWGTWKLAHE